MKLFLVLAFVSCGIIGPDLRAQPPLTNDDVPNLVKSGLSEEFILNLIEQPGSILSGDPVRLVELKNRGVSERLIAAVVKNSPPDAPMTNNAVVQLVKAGFSEAFIIDLLGQRRGAFSTGAGRIVELKQAGVSERILAVMVSQGAGRELPIGTEIGVRLIDSIDSQRNNAGDEFRATLSDPIRLGETIVVPRGADATIKLVTEKESGKLTGRTELSVQLISFTVDGRLVPVYATSVTERSGSRGARTAKSAAAVGAVGAVIGAIAGGGRGAAIGAGAGAAAGAGSQVFLDGQRVRIPSETILTFATQEAVKLP